MSKTTQTMRPFFRFFGGKWRTAPKYPEPEYPTIVEPFAGSAGYAVRYAGRKVILVEADPVIAGTWKYLIKASPEEVLALPDILPGQDVNTLPVCQEAKWLIEWWLNFGTARPCRTMAAQGVNGVRSDSEKYAVFWGPKVRRRIADQVGRIKHWEVVCGDRTEAPDVEATWFIDPPYSGLGRHYRHSEMDYEKLARWCRGKRGQVIVCECLGADWLPFVPLAREKTCAAKRGGKGVRAVFWTNGKRT